MKYNFGCGPNKKEGYINVDGKNWPNPPDVIQDLIQVPYSFADTDSAEEIVAIEVLEHIPFKYAEKVVAEWRRILKPGGTLIIQVPDCGKMMRLFAEGLVCDCIPHKGTLEQMTTADSHCPECFGKAKINTERWLYSFTGAQKHEFDAHLNVFTNSRMVKILEKIGCDNYEFVEHPFKLIVKIYK